MAEEIKYTKFKLVTTTWCGHTSQPLEYPNKTQAIEQGRFMKRHGFCFAYSVYGCFVDKYGVKKRKLIQKG